MSVINMEQKIDSVAGSVLDNGKKKDDQCVYGLQEGMFSFYKWVFKSPPHVGTISNSLQHA